MKNRKLKIGDKVKIINTCLIEDYELNQIGTLIEIRVNEIRDNTYVVDMGRPRRNDQEWDDSATCWYLRREHIELVNGTGQILFPFMSEVI